MKRHLQHVRLQAIGAARNSGNRVMARLALGLAALGACCLLSGCDAWLDEGTGVSAAKSRAGSGQKSTYIDRKVGSTYEGIKLNPDGTYERTVVDNWGHGYQHKGTWRGYGGSFDTGKSRVSKRLELDSYSDARDIINRGGAQSASKTTKTLSSGEFYMK